MRASTLKRAVVRKDPTFSESQLGFRGFRALLQSLESDGFLTKVATAKPLDTKPMDDLATMLGQEVDPLAFCGEIEQPLLTR